MTESAFQTEYSTMFDAHSAVPFSIPKWNGKCTGKNLKPVYYCGDERKKGDATDAESTTVRLIIAIAKL